MTRLKPTQVYIRSGAFHVILSGEHLIRILGLKLARASSWRYVDNRGWSAPHTRTNPLGYTTIGPTTLTRTLLQKINICLLHQCFMISKRYTVKRLDKLLSIAMFSLLHDNFISLVRNKIRKSYDSNQVSYRRK